MDLMRDRLISLLCGVECAGSDRREGGCGYRDSAKCNRIEKLDYCMIACIADHLLANGVIVPPCKVGDKVHFIGHVSDSIPDFIYDDTITKIGVITRGIIQEKGIDFADIGKTVFLTREEAEQALKGESHGRD